MKKHKKPTSCEDVILASESEARKNILKTRKIKFTTIPHNIDENNVKKELKKLSPRKLVYELAKRKAHSVSQHYPEQIVIGSDQILVFDGKVLSKSRTIKEGIRRIVEMAGKEHMLLSATYIVFRSKYFWGKTKQIKVKTRKLTKKEVQNYAKECGETIKRIVGGYKIEEDKLKWIQKYSGTLDEVLGFPIEGFVNKVNETKRIYVIGDPIEHSLSPEIHNFWIRENKLKALYFKARVTPDKLADFISETRKKKCLGINVTIPHKERVTTLVDDFDESVKTSKAANTIYKKNNKLICTNTDGAGFVMSLFKDHKFVVAKKKVFLIGAGGAAKGIMQELLKNKVDEIIVCNRNKKKAEELVNQFRPYQKNDVSVQDWCEKIIPSRVNLILNTTSVGMRKNEKLVFDLSKVEKKSTLVYDIVYNKKETFFLKNAKKKGFKTANGLGMLVGQAAEAFKFWFGVSPTTKQIKAVKIKLRNLK